MNERVYHVAKAAEEAKRVLYELEAPEAAQVAAANQAFLDNMPSLDTIAEVRVYVACVAHGVRRGYISASQARLLLHAAQLALAAMTRKVQNA